MLICDGFGLTKVNGKHLLTTARILALLPEIRARIYEVATVDLERLIIIGKQLAGLSDDQIMELEPAIYNLFTSDEETYRTWLNEVDAVPPVAAGPPDEAIYPTPTPT